MIELFGLKITYFQVIVTVFGVGLLIFIHELGHFIMAKKFRLKVEKFTFGFGPELIGYTYKETRYAICAIPLGGMVKMPGEDVESSSGSPDEFLSQPWYKRIAIALSGPFMNYLLAVIIFTFVIYVWGLSKPSSSAIIGETIPQYPAQDSGLKPGDRIIKINDKKIETWDDLSNIVHENPAKKLRFIIIRDEKQMVFMIAPKKDPSSGVGLIGITPKFKKEKISFFGSAKYGVKLVVYQSVFTLKYLGEKLIKWEKPEIAGPIGVIQIIAKAAEAGWQNLLYLLAIVSTALGLFNLLPIPILDGGHIFLALIEGVYRKPLSRKVMQTANLLGFVIIIFIFILATYNDITRIAVGSK